MLSVELSEMRAAAGREGQGPISVLELVVERGGLPGLGSRDLPVVYLRDVDEVIHNEGTDAVCRHGGGRAPSARISKEEATCYDLNRPTRHCWLLVCAMLENEACGVPPWCI